MPTSILSPRRTGQLRRALAAGALVLAAACANASGAEPGRLSADDLSRLAARSPRVAVLLFAPDDCLACGANMPQWLTVRRRSPERVAILLTRPPTDSEAVMFARYRIPVDGVIGRGVLPKTERGGKAFLYASGRLSTSGPLADRTVQATLTRELQR